MTCLNSLSQAHLICDEQSSVRWIQKLQQRFKLICTKKCFWSFQRRYCAVIFAFYFKCRILLREILVWAKYSIYTSFIRIGNITIGNQINLQFIGYISLPTNFVQLSSSTWRHYLHNSSMITRFWFYNSATDWKLTHNDRDNDLKWLTHKYSNSLYNWEDM